VINEGVENVDLMKATNQELYDRLLLSMARSDTAPIRHLSPELSDVAASIKYTRCS